MSRTSKDDMASIEPYNDLDRVRELLMGADYAELIALKNVLNDPVDFSQKISGVISEAVSQRMQCDDSLAEVLAPTIKDAIKQSIHLDPHALAESLYPVMGPAIRKSITEALSHMLANMNHLLEQSLSPRSIGWRIDAWRTGRSYSEVVLINTLEYHVEQVFLIHAETSLLIQHVVADMAVSKDPDMVCSMMSAIQDYIHDSFSGNEDEILNAMQLGDLTVIIEKGPRAILAAVVRGNVPESLRVLFSESLEDIHKRCGNSLIDYSGDRDHFLHVEPILNKCLTFQLQDNQSNVKRKKPWFAIIVLVAFSAFAAYLGYQNNQVSRWHKMVINNLEVEPGLVVVESELLDDVLLIRGLRDPLSRLPSLVDQENIPREIEVRYDWKAYVSVEPSIVEVRAKKILQPSEGVFLTVQDEILIVTGEADIYWVESLKKNGSLIPGVDSLDLSDLTTFDPVLNEISSAKKFIESSTFYFESSAIEPTGGNVTVEELSDKISFLNELVQRKGGHVNVKVLGVTDESGSEVFNRKIANQRAENLYKQIVDRKVPEALMNYHAIQDYPELNSSLHERRVIFRVVVLTGE